MRVLDPDSDGTVSLAEADAAGAKKLAAADVDHDGTLDSKEAAMDVSSADCDKDGTLDKTEYSAAVSRVFKAADTDNDGTLDSKDLATPAGERLPRLIQ